MAIPQNIHLLYRSKIIPDHYQQYFSKIKELHPSWNIRVYDDKDALSIVKRKFPQFLDIYTNYTLNIQRIDLFRILIVFLYGGFYLDLDMNCKKKLDELCTFNLVLGEERTFTPNELLESDHFHCLRIANYMFGSKPGHPFWIDFLNAAVKKSVILVCTENDVLETTGPGLLTNVYHQYKKKYTDIVVLKNGKICESLCNKVSCHFGGFAAHMHLGSWRWQ